MISQTISSQSKSAVIKYSDYSNRYFLIAENGTLVDGILYDSMEEAAIHAIAIGLVCNQSAETAYDIPELSECMLTVFNG